MDKPSLIPSMIIAAALLVSSLILSYSLRKLGADIIAAGIHSRKISLEHVNNGRPVKIILDDDSELQIKADPNSGS